MGVNEGSSAGPRARIGRRRSGTRRVVDPRQRERAMAHQKERARWSPRGRGAVKPLHISPAKNRCPNPKRVDPVSARTQTTPRSLLGPREEKKKNGLGGEERATEKRLQVNITHRKHHAIAKDPRCDHGRDPNGCRLKRMDCGVLPEH